MAKSTDKPKKMKEAMIEAENTYQAPPNYKDEIVKNLKARKFTVRNDKGIIYVYYRTAEEYDSIRERFYQAMEDLHYQGSFGIRHLNNGEKEMIGTPKEIEEMEQEE